jgi:hypothetical protein
MKPDTPVNYQKGEHKTEGEHPPFPTYNPLPLPPLPQIFILLRKFYVRNKGI